MKSLRYLAYLVGISVALRTFGLVFAGRTISIGLVSSALYFIVLLTVCSNKNVNINKVAVYYGKQIWLPLLYTLILTVTNTIYSILSTYSNTELFPFSFFLCYVLFLALLLHSLIDPKGPTYALHGFLVGTVFLAVCFYLNIGLEQHEYGSGGLEERFSVFGVNCNELGLYCSLGFFVLLNDFMLNKKHRITQMALMVFVAFLLISLVFATASRSAFLALAMGSVMSVLFYPTKKKTAKIVVLIAGGILLIGLGQFLLNSDLYVIARLYEAAEIGDTSGRTDIINTYLPHVWEHPLFGVGNAGLLDVSKKAFGFVVVDEYGGASPVSPHNVLLECALTTGLTGLVIMLIFWFNVGKCAYNQYKFFNKSTPFIALCCILVSIFFGHVLTDKFGWIVYAYMIGCNMPKKSIRSVIRPGKLVYEKY